jgi:hypothetical protein
MKKCFLLICSGLLFAGVVLSAGEKISLDADNEKVTSALDKLKASGLEIIYSEPDLEKYRITAKFKDQDPATVLQAISTASGLYVKKLSGNIYVVYPPEKAEMLERLSNEIKNKASEQKQKADAYVKELSEKLKAEKQKFEQKVSEKFKSSYNKINDKFAEKQQKFLEYYTLMKVFAAAKDDFAFLAFQPVPKDCEFEISIDDKDVKLKSIVLFRFSADADAVKKLMDIGVTKSKNRLKFDNFPAWWAPGKMDSPMVYSRYSGNYIIQFWTNEKMVYGLHFSFTN